MYRIPPSTIKKLKKIKKLTILKTALTEIIDLFKNYNKEEKQIPIEFNKKTGMPIKFKWNPIAKFEIIDLKGIGYNEPNEEDILLTKYIIKKIKEKTPLLFNDYIFSHITEYNETGSCVCTRYQITVQKVNKL